MKELYVLRVSDVGFCPATGELYLIDPNALLRKMTYSIKRDTYKPIIFHMERHYEPEE